jgi:hypothetical protein
LLQIEVATGFRIQRFEGVIAHPRTARFQIPNKTRARTKPLVPTNPGSDQGTPDPKLRGVHAREAIDELQTLPN